MSKFSEMKLKQTGGVDLSSDERVTTTHEMNNAWHQMLLRLTETREDSDRKSQFSMKIPH